MDFFRKYLRYRVPALLTAAAFAAVFVVTFALYRLPLKAVAYPALLCAAAGAVLLAADYVSKRRAHRALRRIADLPAAQTPELPPSAWVLEPDYRAVIEERYRELADLRARSDALSRETVDYYTAWAHQIKTPITSMRLTLEREDTAVSRKLRADVTEIERYVGMVMAYLRLGSEQSDYVFREYELDAILRECVAGFATEFIDRGLSLDLAETNVRIVTDEKWLSFVLGQILSNALKYTREGGIRIYMDEGELCIADTGAGIDPADLPRVFEKGFTGLNGRRDARASGLGLYLVKSVSDRLGIKVRIESAPGEGTTVRLDLQQYELGLR